MSKLYLKGGSDARRTPLTARGHKQIWMSFLFNWRGGNVADGMAEAAMFHRGDTVVFEVGARGDINGRMQNIVEVIFFPDGSFETKRL